MTVQRVFFVTLPLSICSRLSNWTEKQKKTKVFNDCLAKIALRSPRSQYPGSQPASQELASQEPASQNTGSVRELSLRTHLPTYRYLPTDLSTLLTKLPTYLPTHPLTHLPTYPPTHLPIYPPTHLPTYHYSLLIYTLARTQVHARTERLARGFKI